MEKLLGIALRITVVYLYLLVLARLAGKRTLDKPTPFDFMVSLIIGDFPDDIIWGDVPVAQGLVAMGTIALLHVWVSYLSWRSRAFHRLVVAYPTPVLQLGNLVRTGMARERFTEGELHSALRCQEIETWSDVAEALLEPSGDLSVQRQEAAKPVEKRELVRLEEALA
ncbi:MAG: DUF421 domain-containing protein [Chloroflexota bacterium]|nr:DUF421 domain-containing protein [Chloroflexota bacterium]